MSEFITIGGLFLIGFIASIIVHNNRCEMMKSVATSATCSCMELNATDSHSFSTEESESVSKEFEDILSRLKEGPSVTVKSNGAPCSKNKTFSATFHDGSSFTASLTNAWGKDGGTTSITRTS